MARKPVLQEGWGHLNCSDDTSVDGTESVYGVKQGCSSPTALGLWYKVQVTVTERWSVVCLRVSKELLDLKVPLVHWGCQKSISFRWPLPLLATDQTSINGAQQTPLQVDKPTVFIRSSIQYMILISIWASGPCCVLVWPGELLDHQFVCSLHQFVFKEDMLSSPAWTLHVMTTGEAC